MPNHDRANAFIGPCTPCGLTSISLSFKELFLFSRHHGNSVPSGVDESRSFSCARKGVSKKHFGVGLVPFAT